MKFYRRRELENGVVEHKDIRFNLSKDNTRVFLNISTRQVKDGEVISQSSETVSLTSDEVAKITMGLRIYFTRMLHAEDEQEQKEYEEYLKRKAESQKQESQSLIVEEDEM